MVLSKESTPVTSRLRMEYKGNGLYIRFGAAVSAMGVGSYWVDVHEGDVSEDLSLWNLVLQANDHIQCNYHYPIDPQVKKYVPGDWEKKILTTEKIIGK